MKQPHPYTIRKIAANVAKHTRNVLVMWRGFEQFLDRGVGTAGERKAERPTLVLVQPWQGSGMPWQMIALALLLWRRDSNVVVLWDDSVMNWRNVGEYTEHWCIRRVLKRLPMRSIKLADYLGRGEPCSEAELERLASLNAIKAYLGESWSPKQERYGHEIMRPLRRASEAIDGVLRDLRPHHLVIPGGIFSTSGLYPVIGAAHGIRVASLDPSPKINLVSASGIAAHMMDVERACKLLGPLPPWARQLAVEDWQRRTKGTDQFRSQVVVRSATGNTRRDGVLVALNQSHDTAALGRSRLFEGQDDWMMQTAEWLLRETTSKLTIRQHPSDRLIAGNDDYVARLRARLGNDPRVRFIAAEEPVNTYDLIAAAQVVLPYVSTVGIEAVTMGTPVVQEANAYYRSQGFVSCGDSKAEYFQLIADALAGKLPVTDIQRERAWATYYLSQICSFVPSYFTAYWDDFARWSKGTVDDLAALDDVQDLIEAVEQDIPLCYLRHQRLARSR
jgi:hypothetical protein